MNGISKADANMTRMVMVSREVMRKPFAHVLVVSSLILGLTGCATPEPAKPVSRPANGQPATAPAAVADESVVQSSAVHYVDQQTIPGVGTAMGDVFILPDGGCFGGAQKSGIRWSNGAQMWFGPTVSARSPLRLVQPGSPATKQSGTIENVSDGPLRRAESAIVRKDTVAFRTELDKYPKLVSIRTKEGATLLHTTAWFGRADMATLLIGRGANVKAVDSQGATPLHTAAQLDHKDVAELLLVNGAEVNAKDNTNRTPLHMAAIGTFGGGSMDLTALLLTNRADTNAKDSKGFTPLHMAAGMGEAVWDMHSAGKGSKEVTELLLANKADVNAKANNGQTPLRVATINGNKDVADILRQHGGHE